MWESVVRAGDVCSCKFKETLCHISARFKKRKKKGAVPKEDFSRKKKMAVTKKDPISYYFVRSVPLHKTDNDRSVMATLQGSFYCFSRILRIARVNI